MFIYLTKSLKIQGKVIEIKGEIKVATFLSQLWKTSQKKSEMKQNKIMSQPNGSNWYLQNVLFNSSKVHTEVHMCACVLSCFTGVQLFVTPWSLPDSSVHRILQARMLEWVAMPISKGSSWPRDRTHVSYISCAAGGFFTAEP